VKVIRESEMFNFLKATRFLTFFLLIEYTGQALAQTASGIEVVGEAETSELANLWVGHFSYETKKKSKDMIKKDYDRAKKRIYSLLDKNGIKNDQIKTSHFSINPWKEWRNRKSVDLGFALSQSFYFEIADLERLGKILSEVIEIEGVRMSQLEHKLSYKKRQQVLNTLFSQALKNARVKIDSILRAAGKTFDKYTLISEFLEPDRRGPPVFGAEMAMADQSGGRGKGPGFNISFAPLALKLKAKLRVVAKSK
jgi:uncharacterized protein YggE